MKLAHQFDHGAPKERFDDLGEYSEKNGFSCADFLAVVCARLAGYPQREFETELMVAGHEFKIKITKK
mgnify:CR=1 FL=1